MNIDAVTLDEVRRQAEATRAEIEVLKTALQASGIKKVQRGVAATTGGHEISITVTPVDVSKAMLIVTPQFPATNTNAVTICSGGRLIDSTTVGVFGWYRNGSSLLPIPVAWQLVEF